MQFHKKTCRWPQGYKFMCPLLFVENSSDPTHLISEAKWNSLGLMENSRRGVVQGKMRILEVNLLEVFYFQADHSLNIVTDHIISVSAASFAINPECVLIQQRHARTAKRENNLKILIMKTFLEAVSRSFHLVF